MSVSAMKQALKAFNKIYDGCGEVKKDNISKHSNDLATLVRKDCNFAIANLREAIAEAEKQEPVAELLKLMAEDGVTGVLIEVHRGQLSKSIRTWGECDCPTSTDSDAIIEVQPCLDDDIYDIWVEQEIKEKNVPQP